MSSVILGIRVLPNEFQRVKIDNVNLEDKVRFLKDEAVKHANKGKDSIELMYCGVVLNDDASLSSCGIKPGVMVHVLNKKPAQEPVHNRTLSENEIQQLVIAFKAFTLATGYRTALHVNNSYYFFIYQFIKCIKLILENFKTRDSGKHYSSNSRFG